MLARTLDGRPLANLRRRQGEEIIELNSTIHSTRFNHADVAFSRLVREAEKQVQIDAISPSVEDEYSTHIPYSLSSFSIKKQTPKASAPTKCSADGQLWTDKFKPNRFTDLVDLNDTCVQVLQWAKKWKSFIIREDSSIQFPGVILISGPPGLGKTTLVHMVARALDFSLFEINASEERSGEQVSDRIKAILETNALVTNNSSSSKITAMDTDDAPADFGESNDDDTSTITSVARSTKPNMLLLDEIDGAMERGVISLVLKLISGGPKTLKRPIVCVCNNQYAPALRELQKNVTVVRMQKPNDLSISQRLHSIWTGERKRNSQLINLDRTFFRDLTQAMDGDLRSAILALQFLSHSKAAASEKSSSDLASKLTLSFKDARHNMLQIYQHLFARHARDSPQYCRASQMMGGGAHDDGEVSRMMMGILELYPAAKYYDDTRMSKVCSVLDTFSLVDSSLLGHVDAAYSCMLVCDLAQSLFSSSSHFSFSFPRQDQDMENLLLETKQILQINNHSSRDLMEKIPYLVDLIFSSTGSYFRIANPQLLKTEERTRLQHVAQVMLSQGLTFKVSNRAQILSSFHNEDATSDATTEEQNSASNVIQFALDPPLHQLVAIGKSHAPDDHLASSSSQTPASSAHENSVRSMIASKIASLRINQNRKDLSISEATAATDGPSARSLHLKRAYKTMASASTSTPKKSSATPIKRDFFGRPIAVKEDASPRQQDNICKRIKTSVWYHHNEGFSNAVRRTLRLSDLFTI